MNQIRWYFFFLHTFWNVCTMYIPYWNAWVWEMRHRKLHNAAVQATIIRINSVRVCTIAETPIQFEKVQCHSNNINREMLQYCNWNHFASGFSVYPFKNENLLYCRCYENFVITFSCWLWFYVRFSLKRCEQKERKKRSELNS